MSDFVMMLEGGHTMNVSLTPELEKMVRERVESGRYNNASEVVRDALRHLDSKDRLDHLRALIQVGLDDVERGDVFEFTPELMREIEREADEAFLRGDVPDPDVCP
jgi:antitoxin ParD1/3/4